METEEIRRVEARYAYSADHLDWDGLAGLFTEDGWFAPQDGTGKEVFRAQGRAAIADVLGTRTPAGNQPIHQLLTHEIDFDSPTEAHAVWAMADLIFRTDGSVMRGWGHYHVTYRKTAGQWFIATRSLVRTRLEITD
jgi:ketosteroid isomerase-like protein